MELYKKLQQVPGDNGPIGINNINPELFVSVNVMNLVEI